MFRLTLRATVQMSVDGLNKRLDACARAHVMQEPAAREPVQGTILEAKMKRTCVEIAILPSADSRGEEDVSTAATRAVARCCHSLAQTIARQREE